METNILTESEELQILKNSVKTLKKFVDLQSSDGNWNCSPYDHGMANGLIFAMSLFSEVDGILEYKPKPKEYLHDNPRGHILGSESNDVGC